MSPEVLARVGEPFFSTKAPGQGLGLGLFIARTLSEQMGGRLRLESRPGEAPRRSSRSARGVEGRDPSLPDDAASARSLLIVEDDDVLRSRLARAFRERGFEVREARRRRERRCAAARRTAGVRARGPAPGPALRPRGGARPSASSTRAPRSSC